MIGGKHVIRGSVMRSAIGQSARDIGLDKATLPLVELIPSA